MAEMGIFRSWTTARLVIRGGVVVKDRDATVPRPAGKTDFQKADLILDEFDNVLWDVRVTKEVSTQVQ